MDDDCSVTVSPLHWTAPALIIHGDDDGSGRFRQNEQLDRQLLEQNAPVETTVIPHDMSRFLMSKSWKTVATSLAAYFERVLMTQTGK